MGTAVTGTTVSGYAINDYERSNRLLWGGFEFTFIWSCYASEPKPIPLQNSSSKNIDTVDNVTKSEKPQWLKM
jgi:hypothetical protein